MSLDIVSLFIRADNFTAGAVCCRLMSSTLGSATCLTPRPPTVHLVPHCTRFPNRPRPRRRSRPRPLLHASGINPVGSIDYGFFDHKTAYQRPRTRTTTRTRTIRGSATLPKRARQRFSDVQRRHAFDTPMRTFTSLRYWCERLRSSNRRQTSGGSWWCFPPPSACYLGKRPTTR